MSDIKSNLQQRTWKKELAYHISTDPSRIPLSALNEMLGSEHVHWAKSMPESALMTMVSSSLCFGLYRGAVTERTVAVTDLIGFARCVTDFTTFVYLTDVYVRPEHRAQGLGRWLVGCVQEVIDDMPHLRRSMLLTSSWEQSVPFYQKYMGMHVLAGTPGDLVDGGRGLAVMSRIGGGHPNYMQS